MYLLDINVWMAIAFNQHQKHTSARTWFDGWPAGSRCYFCRYTQMGFLRLATNPKANPLQANANAEPSLGHLRSNHSRPANRLLCRTGELGKPVAGIDPNRHFFAEPLERRVPDGVCDRRRFAGRDVRYGLSAVSRLQRNCADLRKSFLILHESLRTIQTTPPLPATTGPPTPRVRSRRRTGRGWSGRQES